MQEIYFLRHGETDYNKNRIVQGGGIDSSLNEMGRKQGLAFYSQYQAIDFDVVLTSSLKRTRETVQNFICQGIPHESFPEINELNWGKHEGKKSEPNMHKEYRQIVSDWNLGKFHTKVQGGESAYELGNRLQEFLRHLVQRSERKILVCSHGRTLVGLTCLLKEQCLSNMSNYKYGNTGLTKTILRNGKFEVLFINDLEHLRGLA